MPIRKRLRSFTDSVIHWYKNAEFITWSRLAAFGNNPLVKLTILTPLVAQVLIHQDTITLLERYDFTKIEWLYASLMCFFFAQLIYTFHCHRDIKDYPSEVKYVQALNAITPDEELNIELFDEYKIYFKKYGGAIEESKFNSKKYVSEIIFATPDAKIKSHSASGRSIESLKGVNVLVQIERIFTSIEKGKQQETIDWKLIGLSQNPEIANILEECVIETDDNNTSETHILEPFLRWIGSEALSSQWRAKAIARRYKILNKKSLFSRSVAALFYGVGTIYFIYTSVLNVCRVLNTYGWLDYINLFLPECRIFCQ